MLRISNNKNLIKISQKAMNYKATSINDIGKFLLENKQLLLSLEDKSLLSLPKIRDLYVKEAFLAMEKKGNNQNIILGLKSFKEENIVKQSILSGDKNQIQEQLNSTDFLSSFEAKYKALVYYLKSNQH